MKTLTIAAATAVVLVAGGLLAWHYGYLGKPDTGRPQTQAAAASVPVTAGKAETHDMPVFATGLGTVQSVKNVAVKSRVDGPITEVHFEEGQDVKTGDLLFVIDPRPYQALVDQAQANKQKDDAQIQAAQLVLQRYQKLLASSVQTQEAYDNQKATVGQLEASIKADQALIDTAQLNLSFTQVRAPIDGRTGARLVDPGNMVQVSQNQTLVTIAQVKPIFVSFTVAQDLLDQIRQNQEKQQLDVIAYASDDATKLSAGKLTLIDNQIDVTTGTIHLKALFGNADERLWPGEFVSARLVLSVRQNAVTVSAPTVMQGPDGPYVYVIKPDQTVERRPVQISSTQDGLAVISKGLAAGEPVVTEGQYRLNDGSKIAVGAPQPAPGSAAQAEGAAQAGGGAPATASR